jgi:hypothetical protein
VRAVTGPSPTDGLRALAAAAAAARAAASGLRWLAACAAGFAGLLGLAVALAAVERGGGEPAGAPASAWLDFDLAVLRATAGRSLADPASDALPALWLHRPDWRLPEETATPAARLVSPRDAWVAAASDKSRFRTAAQGAAGALPLLLGALSLALFGAAAGGAIAHGRSRLALAAAVAALVLLPLWPLFDPGVFYDRTRSLGTGLAAALFVAAFAGALPCAAAQALAGGRRASVAQSFASAARLAVLDATAWLVPLVPALAAAAVFAAAKADQDPAIGGPASGLGALIRTALRETSAGERLSSGALVGGALLLLFWLGHRFLLAVREALSARSVA